MPLEIKFCELESYLTRAEEVGTCIAFCACAPDENLYVTRAVLNNAAKVCSSIYGRELFTLTS